MGANKEALEVLSTKEYYEYVAHQIEREDGLINTRITWMLTFEGFLFASLALVAEQGKVSEELYAVLKMVLPILGAVIGVLAYSSVEAALSALKALKEGWKEREPGVTGVYPRAFGKDWPHILASLHSRGLPIAVVVSWVIIWWCLRTSS